MTLIRWLLTLSAIALPGLAGAQELSLSFGDDGTLTARSVQLIALLTVLSLVPGLAVMLTCFPFIVTVLVILRQAIGLQQSPPNMMIVSLALFLTYFVMEPTFLDAWQNGIAPMVAQEITAEQSFARSLDPFRSFMAARIDAETF